jgi:16S rRNA pseudouridine516 synthase
MRLDKYVTFAGLTRSAAAGAIKAGRVAVGDTIIKNPAEKVGDSAVVTLDGIHIDGSEFVYLLMNKPAGYVCENSRPDSVFSLLPEKYSRRALSVCGRLDKDTEGFLLLSDDGDFVHRIISPAKHLPKVYFARLKTPITDSDIKAFEAGIKLSDDEICRPAKLEKNDEPLEVFIEISEGKYHQIKRMFHARENEVLYLKRVKTGGLSLPDSLKPGEILLLHEPETARIFHGNSDKITLSELGLSNCIKNCY